MAQDAGGRGVLLTLVPTIGYADGRMPVARGRGAGGLMRKAQAQPVPPQTGQSVATPVGGGVGQARI